MIYVASEQHKMRMKMEDLAIGQNEGKQKPVNAIRKTVLRRLHV